jgi:hypothetical protein
LTGRIDIKGFRFCQSRNGFLGVFKKLGVGDDRWQKASDPEP